MDQVRALKIAVEAIDREIQRFAVDGNLYTHAGARYPQAVKAAKKREELKLAKATLINLMLGRANSSPQQLTLENTGNGSR
jgi:hypothetical protein